MELLLTLLHLLSRTMSAAWTCSFIRREKWLSDSSQPADKLVTTSCFVVGCAHAAEPCQTVLYTVWHRAAVGGPRVRAWMQETAQRATE